MAIAGSMTTAYRISFVFGELVVKVTTHPRSGCVSPADAVAKLRNNEEVIVAGGDMTEFNRLWEMRDDGEAKD